MLLGVEEWLFLERAAHYVALSEVDSLFLESSGGQPVPKIALEGVDV